MTRADYEASKHLHQEALHLEANVYLWQQGPDPFYSLLMAAMRVADSENLVKLATEWPATLAELRARYNAPGGKLEGDQ